MSSERRINASRRNGALSRGPKTAEGKRRSSRNNLRHGMRAQTVVLADEDENIFKDFVATLEAQYQPCNQTEKDLVESMAIARWRVVRLRFIEISNLQDDIDKDSTPGRDYTTRAALAFRKLCAESNSIELLCRYEARYDRQYHRSLNLLMNLKASRPLPKIKICRTNRTNLIPKTDSPA